jgi:hypothetical protein
MGNSDWRWISFCGKSLVVRAAGHLKLPLVEKTSS